MLLHQIFGFYELPGLPLVFGVPLHENSASRADVSAPIHDWTVHIGSGDYGIDSWTPGYWNMYWDSRIEPGARVSFQHAVVLLETFLIAIIACPLAVLLVRLLGVTYRAMHCG
ncbi:MAG: hypothetical protein C5B58_06425 [Acidobacteria bacterium]|nr:MAG: hypothetical protein C5B58_06425 [Acidobacteriota bacterium]